MTGLEVERKKCWYGLTIEAPSRRKPSAASAEGAGYGDWDGVSENGFGAF